MSSPWQDVDTLRELYWGEGLNQEEVAERLGCSRSCVDKWMGRLGIKRRSSGPEPHPTLKDAEELQRLYHEEGLTGEEIGERIGVSGRTVLRWMNRLGIGVLNPGEASKKSNLLDAPYYTTDDRGYEKWQVGVDYERHTVAVHRLVAVAEFGLDAFGRDTVVHHKNNIPWDNRPENLELMGRGQHSTLHNAERKASQ